MPMERFMLRRLSIIAGILLCFGMSASAQTPSPEAIGAAKSLLAAMRIPDQYRALLPAILLGLRPVVTQDRPELERDYDAMTPSIVEAYAPYYNQMLEQAATVYAANFTVDEMRQIEAFCRQPVGQKLLDKWPAITQQTTQIGQDVSRKASEELKLRLTEALRQKGHKL